MLDMTEKRDPALPEAPPVPAPREADVGPVRVSAAQVMGILRVAALVAAAGLVLYLFSHEALLLFFAVLLGCSLRGAADTSGKLLHLPAAVMLGLISLLILAVIGGGLWLLGPRLTQEGTDLVGKLTHEGDTLLRHYSSTPWGETIRQHMSGSMPSAGTVTAPAFKVAGLTLGALADLVLVLITALYLAISPELYQRGMLRLIAIRHRARALGIMRLVGRTMRRWLLGQLIDMVVVGVITAIGLSLIHVPVPLALGVLAGLMTFVPYFGAALAGIPAVLVALTVGADTALYAAGVFVLCHLVEGYVLSPLVQKRLVELPPALTLLSLAAAGSVFGPLGIIMGTPIAAAAMVAIREGYVVDVLGDTDAHDEDSGAPAPRLRPE